MGKQQYKTSHPCCKEDILKPKSARKMRPVSTSKRLQAASVMMLAVKKGHAMQAVIQTKLQHTERERHINILWAIESGSRAWGFASPDSDYDVRAVYVQAPEQYLQVDAAEEGLSG